MLSKLFRAYAIARLTKRYFRACQIPRESCVYNINGVMRTVYGQQALAMLLEIVISDVYGLKRFKYLDNIIDVGANIGIFALHAATLFPAVKIAAYEPSHKLMPNLKKNLSQLNVEIFPYAVGALSRKAALIYKADLSASYIDSNSEIGTVENQECEMISLDEVVANSRAPIGLLKLDCEGSEFEIMQAASFEDVRYVVGEFHACQDGDPELGINILKQRNFSVDKWFPFQDGKAGIFWASNNRYMNGKRSWLL